MHAQTNKKNYDMYTDAKHFTEWLQELIDSGFSEHDNKGQIVKFKI
jgi:hypothetical protein